MLVLDDIVVLGQTGTGFTGPSPRPGTLADVRVLVAEDDLRMAALLEQLLAEAPALRVVLASGYSLDLAQQGLPAERCTFLSKPYDKARVAEVVRSALQSVG